MMNFRERIKELCKEKRITQKELAERLGITDISLNKTLRGDYPRLQSLEMIAKVLDVNIKELFGISEQQKSDTINCPYCGGKIKVTKSADKE
jgi:transcriptional regulator with XRE-family HTH domain